MGKECGCGYMQTSMQNESGSSLKLASIDLWSCRFSRAKGRACWDQTSNMEALNVDFQSSS